ncbi:MAG TPA: hypothetical protein VMS76_18105 [Planctomycetota bacterium]|nr:hypothetical protein [Planctomycetota bacterium]
MTSIHPLLLAILLAAPAAAQTDIVYTIPRPAGVPHDWASRMFALPDLDGDGVGELGLGTRTHGAGKVAWVHSGANGALLFALAVPNVPLFFGQSLVAVDDRDGDGVRDLVMVGTHSGAANSPDGWIEVYSGAHGGLLAHMVPPAGIVLMEGPAIALGDVDGDGHTDVLCRADPVAAIGSPHLQLFSGATGAALYSGVAEPPGSNIGNKVVRLEDRDGDGVDEFATTGLDALGPRVDVRSGLTGHVLAVHRGPSIGLLSGNNEPLVRTPDRDGDGLDDLAVGTFFEDLARNFSSSTGSLLNQWSSSPASSLFAFLMVAPGDLDLDGTGDLLTVEQQTDGQGNVIGTALVGLDLAGAQPIFSHLVPELGGPYDAALVELPGADPWGFASFATFEDGADAVRVRRYAPEIGMPYCASTPNSTGQAATMRALGSASLARDLLVLEARGVVPSKFGLFFYGPSAVQMPFGSGFLCVGGGATGIARLPVGMSDGSGRMTHRLDFGAPPTPATQITAGSTWHFQCWFRDPGQASGFQTSDAVAVTFLP